MLDMDLDLYLFDVTAGTWVTTSSTSFDSSYEGVDIAVVSGHSYQILVEWGRLSHPTYIGVAWYNY